MSLPARIFSRREFVGIAAGSAAALLGCVGPGDTTGGSARLSARPGTPTLTVAPGLVRLGTGDVHDGYLYVPLGYQPGTPKPLILALHGAGGDVTAPLALLEPYADAQGFFVVAVNSSDLTWDGLNSKFGPDVAIIDTALQRAFQRVKVDSTRIGVQGFSDGASYALAIGLNNGSLFTRVAANSPGSIPEPDSARQGKPDVFISHGRNDPILPIDGASRVIVPRLQSEGYSVTYLEFDDGHAIPTAIADATVAWLLR